MTPFQAKAAYSLGVFCLSIFSGLAVYQTPPESWAEFGGWIWQPAMQGLMQALGTLGIGAGVQAIGRKNGGRPT